MIIEESLASADVRSRFELQGQCKTEAAILETDADHRLLLSSSSFQNMPEDVLREICIAFIGADFPILESRVLPLPYMLMQISSEIRRIVLTTPSIWASVINTLYMDALQRAKLCTPIKHGKYSISSVLLL